MPGNDWLADAPQPRSPPTAFSTPPSELFTQHDPASIGMNEIARAAGCSRATLYRYFENRDALHTAYVHRETHRLGREIIAATSTASSDPRERLIASITRHAADGSRKPGLASWFATTRPPIGGEMAEQSEVITALAAAFLTSLGPDDPDIVERRARWLVRVIDLAADVPGPRRSRRAGDDRGIRRADVRRFTGRR